MYVLCIVAILLIFFPQVEPTSKLQHESSFVLSFHTLALFIIDLTPNTSHSKLVLQDVYSFVNYCTFIVNDLSEHYYIHIVLKRFC